MLFMRYFDTKLLLFFLLFPGVSAAENITPILDSIKPNSITIIGETHQLPESTKLFQNLIKGYLKNNECLTVALEIDSNQQKTIDKLIEGRAVVSAIEISPTIDHAAYRNMLEDLAAQKRKGICLKILAIDAGDEIKMSRDEWMAINLTGQVGDSPVLVLLGGLHSLKKVDWDLSMTKGTASVAKILSKQGYHVNSYPQVWEKSVCNNGQQFQSRFISNETAEALAMLNKYYFSLLNAFEPDSAVGVVDGVIVWECS